MKQYYKQIDGWKGLLCIIIVLLHMEQPLFGVQKYFQTGYLAVEAFFIISGFLLALSLHDKKPEEIFINKIILKRIYKLYPIYITGMILVSYWYFDRFGINLKSYIDFLGEAILIQMIGFYYPNAVNGAGWFISSLFIGITFILVFYKYLTKYFLGVSLIIVIFSYNYLTGFGNLDIISPYPANIRAIAGLLLGVIVFTITNKNNRFIKTDNKICYILEILMIISFILMIFKNTKSNNDGFFVISFSILFTMSIASDSLCKYILSNKLFIWLGKLSLYIYLTHLFVILVFFNLNKIFYSMPTQKSYIFRMFICLLLVVLFAHFCRAMLTNTDRFIKKFTLNQKS